MNKYINMPHELEKIFFLRVKMDHPNVRVCVTLSACLSNAVECTSWNHADGSYSSYDNAIDTTADNFPKNLLYRRIVRWLTAHGVVTR
jgi:hypothetical protein